MSTALALIVLLWGIGAYLLVLAGIALQRDALRRRPALPLLLLASAVYAIGYGLELGAQDVAWALHAVTLQYVAIASFPLLVVLLAYDITRLRPLGQRALWAVLAVVGIGALALVAGNARHDLFHAAARIEPSGGLALLSFEPGPAYVTFQVVSALCLLGAGAALLVYGVRRDTPVPLRWQSLLTLGGVLAPWLAFLAFRVGPWPVGLDVSPFAFAITGSLAYVAVTRYGLADVSPIARALVFDRMLDPVLVVDTHGRVVDINEAGAALLDALSLGPGRGRHLSEILGSDAVPAGLLNGIDPASTLVEGEPVRLAGRSFDVRLARVRLRRGTDLGSAVVLRDISDHVQLQDALTHLAHTDELTGIANRRHFIRLSERVLERAARDGSATSLAIVDLDRFKSVNDRHGHLIGDRLLRRVARAVAQRLRPTDLVGRFGGEEFAVCLPSTDAYEARGVAERIRAAVRSTTVAADDGESVGVTASVGVYTATGAACERLETVLMRADEAQYTAKRAGGDRVVDGVS